MTGTIQKTLKNGGQNGRRLAISTWLLTIRSTTEVINDRAKNKFQQSMRAMLLVKWNEKPQEAQRELLLTES